MSHCALGQLPTGDTLSNWLGKHVIDGLARLFVDLVLAAARQTFWERVFVDVVLIVELWHGES